MIVKYYLSPDIPSSLSSFLESSLSHLSLSFPPSSPSSPSSSSFQRDNEITLETQIIICLPNHSQLIRRSLSHSVSFVTPLWVISSLLSCSIQPVEGYLADLEKLFSGVILSFENEIQVIQSSQKLSAYSSYLRHYGGQVYEKSHSLYTHRYTSHQLNALSKPTETPSSNPFLSKKPSNYPTVIYETLLKLYSYLYSLFYLYPNSKSYSFSSPITLPILPIFVNPLWIELTLCQSSRSISHHSYSSTHETYTLHSLLTTLLMSITQIPFLERKSLFNSWDTRLSDCPYLPLLQVMKSKSRHRSPTPLFKNCVFLLSSHYSSAMGIGLSEVVKYLEGSVHDSFRNSVGPVYIVSPNLNCPLVHSILERLNDYKENGNNIYFISQIYLYSCLLYKTVLPLTPLSYSSLISLPTDQELIDSWNILFASSASSRISASIFYSSLSTFFSPLYRPSPSSPLSTFISEMIPCVISLSGYRDRDETNEAEEMSVCDEKGERYGRRELKQAIRLTGACYSGPLLSHVVTHLICSSMNSKKCQYALSTNPSLSSSSPLSHPIHIVNERWIIECLRQNRRVEEKDFLPVFLQQIKRSPTPSPSQQRSPPRESHSKTERASTHEVDAIKHLLDRVNPQNNNQLEFQYSEESQVRSKEMIEERGEGNLQVNDTHEPENRFDERPESEVIEEDIFLPSDEVGEDKIVDLGDAKETTPPIVLSPSRSISSAPAALPNPLESPTVLNFPPQPISHPPESFLFLFGGGNASHIKSGEEEGKMIVKKLGGIVLSSSSPISLTHCTHLILWELKRTEKFLCCCGAGKWILHPSYLMACQESGKFIDEKPYEWGSPGLPESIIEKTIWLGACRRGRLKMKKTQLPFQDLKICIDLRGGGGHTTQRPPVETLKRIIEFGGGIVKKICRDQEEGEGKEEDEQEGEEESERNSSIDYIVKYPTKDHVKVKEGVEREEEETDLYDSFASCNSLSTVVLSSSYFLDRISMERVDLRDYILPSPSVYPSPMKGERRKFHDVEHEQGEENVEEFIKKSRRII